VIKQAEDDGESYSIMVNNLESISAISSILKESIVDNNDLDQTKVNGDLRAADWLYSFAYYLKSLYEGYG